VEGLLTTPNPTGSPTEAKSQSLQESPPRRLANHKLLELAPCNAHLVVLQPAYLDRLSECGVGFENGRGVRHEGLALLGLVVVFRPSSATSVRKSFSKAKEWPSFSFLPLPRRGKNGGAAWIPLLLDAASILGATFYFLCYVSTRHCISTRGCFSVGC